MRNLIMKTIFFLTLLFTSTSKVHPFKVADLVDIERIGPPVVNSDGRLAAFTLYNYDQKLNKHSKCLSLLDLTNDVQTRLTKKDFSYTDDNPVWLSKDILAFLSTRSGTSQIWTLNITDSSLLQLTDYPLPLQFLKSHPDSKSLAFVAEIYPESGDINESAMLKKIEEGQFSSGRVYDNLFVRHWDVWVHPVRRNQLFVLKFKFINGRVEVKSTVNVLKGTVLETPVGTMGDESHFEFSPDGSEIAFTSRVPEKEAAWNTNLDIYITSTSGKNKPYSISGKNKGSDSNPTYSPDGRFLSWLQMETPGYESDLNRVVLFDRKSEKIKILTKHFDRSVDSIIWSKDSKKLYAKAQDLGHLKIFSVDVASASIKQVVKDGHNTALSIIEGAKDQKEHLLFLRATSSTPADIYSVQPSDSAFIRQRTAVNERKLVNKLMSEPIEFWFKGYNNEPVMGWLYMPSSFSNQERYPLAFLMHGGPEDSWNNDFSYRWNPQIFAGSGFAVVAINFHGSTGYGGNFTRSILGNWGGAPYESLMKGLKYVLKKYSFIDKKRVCALGASYGGYMANWVNGNTNAFSCIVNHDGIFDTRAAYYSTEELWFPESEFKGPAYTKGSLYEKWNPSLRVTKWTTPTLVIHSELDFRLPITEGLSTFTALQRQGIPSKLLYFPDENHWILKPANTIKWYTEVLSFISMWTEPRSRNPEVIKYKKYRKNLLKVQEALLDTEIVEKIVDENDGKKFPDIELNVDERNFEVFSDL
ncbi:hypothetical protein HDU92_005236 [Lobulomyces angularis]|nr:hypothetical protein HDU92_005236 [Lobulomyces angularis]